MALGAGMQSTGFLELSEFMSPTMRKYSATPVPYVMPGA